MNTTPAPDDARLDSLLREWSRRQSADSETLDRLRRTILQQTSGPVRAAARPSTRPPSRHRDRGVVAVCLLAASLLIVVGNFTASDRWTNSVTDLGDGRQARTKLAALWNETGRLFGSDRDWICDLDGELLIGIGDARESSPAEPVCLLLTLRVFDPARQTWVTSWRGQIQCAGGATVDFAAADQRSAGSIWVQSRPDGRYAVSHWLSWRDHPELSGPIDATVVTDRPQVVAEKVMDGRRIQIVQQVWRPNVG